MDTQKFRMGLFALVPLLASCGGGGGDSGSNNGGGTPPPLPTPTVAISSPSAGEHVSGPVTITASVKGSQITQGGIYIDGTSVLSNPASYTYDWDSTAAGNGPHKIRVSAQNPSGIGSQEITVMVDNAPPPPPPNQAPVADAGPDQSARGGSVALLDGSGSTDPDGDALSYSWTQTGGPVVTLKDPTAAKTEWNTPIMQGTVSLDFELTVTDPGGLSSTDSVNVLVSSDYTPCTPTAPPASLGRDPAVFKKYCDADGIAIISDEQTADETLSWVRYLVMELPKIRPDVQNQLVQAGTVVAIFADGKQITDIPGVPSAQELINAFGYVPNGISIDELSVVGEANVMCYPPGVDGVATVLFHEYAHQMNGALWTIDPTWGSRLTDTYNAAKNQGLWAGKFIMKSSAEYWANGVDLFYSTVVPAPNTQFDVPINRDMLAQYDPALYSLLLEVMPDQVPTCPP